MKLTELFQYVVTATGEHLLGDPEDFGLTLDTFWQSIQPDFEEYERFYPLTKTIHVEINTNNMLGGKYDFSKDPNNIGYDPDDTVSSVNGAMPEWISRVVPVNQTRMLMNPLWWRLAGNFASPSRLIVPRTMLIDYRKPYLYITEPGRFEVQAHYRRLLEYSYGGTEEDPILQDVEIHNLERSKIFLDLMVARFLLTVGRMRRSFTYDRLPITVDGNKMVDEATVMYEQARRNMAMCQAWTKAFRP